jgi:hypothetical protein
VLFKKRRPVELPATATVLKGEEDQQQKRTLSVNRSSTRDLRCHDSRAKLGPEARQYDCTEKPELGGMECLRQTTVGVG